MNTKTKVFSELPEDIILGTGVYIGKNVVIGTGCVIGDDVLIANGVVIGDDVDIGNDSAIEHDSRIGNYVTIGPWITLGVECIVHPHAYIGDVDNPNPVRVNSRNVIIEKLVSIGRNTIIRSGVLIQESTTLEAQCYIGNGSIVRRISTLSTGTHLGNNISLTEAINTAPGAVITN